MWLDRLGAEERYVDAVEELWPYALGVLAPSCGRCWRSAWAGRRSRLSSGRHPGAEFAELWDEMTMVRRSAPVGAQW